MDDKVAEIILKQIENANSKIDELIKDMAVVKTKLAVYTSLIGTIAGLVGGALIHLVMH